VPIAQGYPTKRREQEVVILFSRQCSFLPLALAAQSTRPATLLRGDTVIESVLAQVVLRLDILKT
jgi:hypothetical protein